VATIYDQCYYSNHAVHGFSPAKIYGMAEFMTTATILKYSCKGMLELLAQTVLVNTLLWLILIMQLSGVNLVDTGTGT
jgi:hypothetical protein